MLVQTYGMLACRFNALCAASFVRGWMYVQSTSRLYIIARSDLGGETLYIDLMYLLTLLCPPPSSCGLSWCLGSRCLAEPAHTGIPSASKAKTQSLTSGGWVCSFATRDTHTEYPSLFSQRLSVRAACHALYSPTSVCDRKRPVNGARFVC